MQGVVVVTEGGEAPAVFEVRGETVMRDAQAVIAFGTETRRTSEAVSRNSLKSNNNHTFQVTPDEVKGLKSQLATSNEGVGHEG